MHKPKLSEVVVGETIRKAYEVDLLAGTIRADTSDDHARAMEAVDKMGGFLQQLAFAQQSRPAAKGLLEPVNFPLPETVKAAPSPKLAVVVEKWLAERAKKNAERTVTAKRYHMADFMRRTESDVEVNALNKASIVAYKTVLLDEGQSGKTLDNKLMTLMDFFKYAMNHGIYTVSNSNPVDGLFVLTKAERIAKNEPYEAFEPHELSAFLAQSLYLAHMNAPDLYWGPLIGLYTGMRISEVTQIRCSEIKRAANGVDYLHVPISKTSAGIRNVPIASALIDLGFLEYVAEVRQAGAQRLFPHRSFVNGTYSKRLSEEMLAYQKLLGIKVEGEKKSFHSFRVNVITSLANSGANTMQVMKIVGHATAEKGMEVHAGYVRDLPDLKLVLDKLDWPIDFDAMRYRGQFKAFISNSKNWSHNKKPKKKTVTGKVASVV